MPCLIRDVVKREARKPGSYEAGKKKKPFGLVLNACGDVEGCERWRTKYRQRKNFGRVI